ncbi:LPXTG cell wall anchor domain-containing protein [Kitasatospora sp. NPDC007106]|uniref:LPXTG cell wall anchor domain-containing protein n=1 Tax=Kitasatospora sp. NPDC007106 TaxID=3156914 RepID=UPI0033D3B28A
MRAPVISRFVRNAAVTTAAAVAVGVGLPVLTGGTAAWACGDEPAPAATATATAPQVSHGGSSAFLPAPTGVTAGGAPVEIGMEQYNDTGAAIPALAPSFALFASEPVPGTNRLVNLQPENVKVEVKFHGQWKRLSLRHSCDPTLVANTASLAEPVAAGRAHRYTFRLTVLADVPAQIRTVDLFSGQGSNDHITLAVKHPAPTAPATTTPTRTKPATTAPARTAPTRAASATTAAAPVRAALPAAATTAPATARATTVPTTAPAAPATELAQTGPSSATAFLFASGGVLLVLGGGVLLSVKRLARR